MSRNFSADTEAFAYLRDEILPQLITRARERDYVLRFWAAGCATGEEPYSLAMLLVDLLGAELSPMEHQNLCDRPGWGGDQLCPARDVFREFAQGVFLLSTASVSLIASITGIKFRKYCARWLFFGQQDLSRSAPFPRIDLVLCRNVLIYFTSELQDYVLNQFAFSLSQQGYLFLGKAETVRPTQTFYELVNKHWKVYRCTGNALPSMRRQVIAGMNPRRLEGHLMNRQTNRGTPAMDQDQPNRALEVGQARRFNELMLRSLPLGVVVIDRNYRLLTANGMARRLLGLREAGLEQDFLHAVRGHPLS